MPATCEAREPASPATSHPAPKAEEQRSPTPTDAPPPGDQQAGEGERASPGRRWGDALGIERDTAPLDE